MKKKKKNIVITAVDIGASKIAAVIAVLNKEGTFSIKGFGECATLGFNNGTFSDIKKLSQCIKTAIDIAEEKADITAENIYAGISGSFFITVPSSTRLNIDGQQGKEAAKVTQDHIDKLIKVATDLALSQQDDKNLELIHSIPLNFKVDNTTTFNPLEMNGYVIHIYEWVVFAELTAIKNIETCFSLINLPVQEIVFSPLATSKAVLSKDDKDLGCMMVDIGAATTNIALFFGANFAYYYTNNFGGNYLTTNIKDKLGIPLREAEALKLACPDVFSDEPGLNDTGIVKTDEGEQIFRKYGPLKSQLKTWTQDILSYPYQIIMTDKTKDYMKGGIILTGGTSKLKELKSFVASTFDIKVRVGLPNQDIFVEKLDTLKNPIYSTVVGLLHYAYEIHSDNLSIKVVKTKKSDNVLQNIMNRIVTIAKEIFE